MLLRFSFLHLQALVAAAYLLLLSACGDDAPDPMAGAMPVRVAAPIQQRLTEWDEYTGRFRAREQVDIQARVSGYLQEIRFTDGQEVKKGDVLFVIDQRPFVIALKRAEARFELASKDYERAKSLRSSSAMSGQELDRRAQEYRDAKAALDEARLQLEFTEVTSPINGRVSRHLVDVGNMVIGGDVSPSLLTRVVSLNPIDFYFEASEKEVLKYLRLSAAGKRESARTMRYPAWVKLQDEREYGRQGEVDFVDNALDNQTGTLQARAVFENPNGLLLPGFFGRLRLAGSEEYEAMLVPDEVIGTNQSQKFVYIVNAESEVEPRPVEIGAIYEKGLRIIRAGLSPSDRVIMGGITILRPGMKVQPMPMEALAKAPQLQAKPAEPPPAEEPATAEPEPEREPSPPHEAAEEPEDEQAPTLQEIEIDASLMDDIADEVNIKADALSEEIAE